MPAWWKLRRELARLGRQLGELPSDLHNYFLETTRYDRGRSAGLRRFEGGQPATG